MITTDAGPADRPDRRHLGLLHSRDDPSVTGKAIVSWLRSATEQGFKTCTVSDAAAPEPTALGPADLHPSTAPVDLVERALSEGFAGLAVLVRADHVIAATSREFHDDIEAALSALCTGHPVSVLCVYDRPGVGVERLGTAVAHHGGGLREQQLTVRRGEDVVELGGEIDMTNLDVVDTVLQQVAAAPPGGLCIDLTAVTFLSAGAARLLHRHATALGDRGVDVEFGGVPPHLRRVLRLVEAFSR